ncbi:MAG: YceH family protein [Planctomycetes bacterium]|nr:YceH family protein [Planctomycetota bacterium]MCW8134700.1 YceH family protein [Planctomycetota bacterium]
METLNAIERRVIGTLIEKSLTTPQHYPLSLNALTNGCNQKSARDPETSYTDQEVLDTCNALKRRSMVTEFFGAGARVSKWEEALVALLDLTPPQAAVISELLLRGPQTEGELRQRASRMAAINDLPALHQVLQSLSEREKPLARRVSDPNRARGVIWAHCFYPPAEAPQAEAFASTRVSPTTPPTSQTSALEERIAALEARVASLEESLGIKKQEPGAPATG